MFGRGKAFTVQCRSGYGKSRNSNSNRTFFPKATKKRPEYNNNSGIMNNGFADYPERPHTPSFVGSYSSVHDPQTDRYMYKRDAPASASYLYREEAPATAPYGYGGGAPRRATTLSTSASTVGFLPPKKKTHRSKCGKSCVLLVLLACFIILSVVMIVLYLTRPVKAEKESVNDNIKGNTQPTVNIKIAIKRTNLSFSAFKWWRGHKNPGQNTPKMLAYVVT